MSGPIPIARIEIGGISMSYQDLGSGEPLVLLHGTEADRRQFDTFIPHLGQGIRALPYDQRDTNMEYDSSAPDYSMADLGDDCAAFIEALGVGRAHILGTSFGGAVAMNAAIRHPERVKSLVLAATTPSWDMVEPLGNQGIIAVAEPVERERFMLSLMLSPRSLTEHPELIDEVRTALTVRTPEQNIRRRAALTSLNCRDDLDKIKAPTLVLHGTDDPIIKPTTGRWISDHIPNSEFVPLEGLYHGITFEGKERCGKLVHDFVLAHA